MEGVWQCEGKASPYGITVREVHNQLYPRGQKAYTTVQTIMNILFEKGFLKREKIGMVNFYTPTVSREEMARQETHTLVSRAFGGSFVALANHLVDSGSLSEKELAVLKGLIDAKERKRKG
jgi:predicted transcriptional regulator